MISWKRRVIWRGRTMPVRRQWMLDGCVSVILGRITHADAYATATSLAAEAALGLAEHLHR